MKRLHLFIIKAFIGPFILNLIITDFLFLMIWMWKYVDDLIGKGLDLSIILEMMWYAALWHVPMCLPLSILLSSIMAFGKLGETNELTSLKSLGISLQKTMFSLIVFNAMISVGAFYFSNIALPLTAFKMHSLLNDIVQKKPELNIPEGVFYNGMHDYTIRVDKKYKDQTMRGVMLFDHHSSDNNSFMIADSGRIENIMGGKYMKLSLVNGHAYKEDRSLNDQNPNSIRTLLRSTFKEHIIYIDMSAYNFNKTEGTVFRSSAQMMNIDQLDYSIDSLDLELVNRRKSLEKDMNTYYYFNNDSLAKLDTVKAMSLDSNIMAMIPADKKLNVLQEAEQVVRSAQGYPSRSQMFEEDLSKSKNNYRLEWHKKFTLSVACFILFFIGAPLGAIVRKGGLGWPVVIAVLFFLVYYVISIIFEKMAKNNNIDAMIGMWMASAVLMPIGVFLTYKSTRDSKLFSMANYMGGIRKIGSIFKKR